MEVRKTLNDAENSYRGVRFKYPPPLVKGRFGDFVFLFFHNPTTTVIFLKTP